VHHAVGQGEARQDSDANKGLGAGRPKGGESVDDARESVKVEYPADVRVTLRDSKEEFAQELKMLAAVKLYELGRISSGKAAALAGMDRTTFLLSLGQYRVPVFNYTTAEVEREVEEAKARAGG